jgi:predicted nuclease of predicted toxin-antitoxin system
VRGLLRRQAALDLVSIQLAGLSGAVDPEVLAWAASEQRVLLTHDVATIPYHACQRVGAGQAMSEFSSSAMTFPL